MLVTFITMALILIIVVGVSLYARKRVRKVMREAAARSAAREAALLAEVASAKGEHPDAATAPVRADAAVAVETGATTSVEDDMRAFFGSGSPAVPAPGPAVDPVEPVSAPGPGETAAVLVAALRSVIEQVQTAGFESGGSEAERTARTVEVFLAEVAGLPMAVEQCFSATPQLDSMDTSK